MDCSSLARSGRAGCGRGRARHADHGPGLYRAYRDGGGREAFAEWESSEGLVGWEHAPAPALVAKRLLEDSGKREVAPRYARALSNIMHWGFGVANGAGYGLVFASHRLPRVWLGLPFGAAVWAGGYVVLPLLGVYQPIWKYDAKTLANDLSAHLVFGLTTAVVFRFSTKGQVR